MGREAGSPPAAAGRGTFLLTSWQTQTLAEFRTYEVDAASLEEARTLLQDAQGRAQDASRADRGGPGIRDVTGALAGRIPVREPGMVQVLDPTFVIDSESGVAAVDAAGRPLPGEPMPEALAPG